MKRYNAKIKELLSEGYDFVMTSRLQSDPIERRFSQYRQMNGGRFLVSLREVTNSERIIRYRSLVKADINFWKEDLGSDKPSLDFSALLALLSEHEIEIAESTLDSSSEEVSTTIAGYIAWHYMCGQHILKFLIGFLPRLTFVIQNITIGD